MKKSKILISILAATMFMFSCSSDDTDINDNDPTVVSDGDSNDSDNSDDSDDSDTKTTVTNAKISLVKDADRSTNWNGNVAESVTYSISTNTYYFILTGANADNSYQLKLTGETVADEYFIDLEVGPNGVPQYSLDPATVAVAPDLYTAEIYEVETDALINLESFQFGSGSNAVDQDYYFTINNSFNDGEISFTEPTVGTSSYIYNDLTSITINKNSTDKLKIRFLTVEVGATYMQIYNTDGTSIHHKITSSGVVLGHSTTEYFEYNQSHFTELSSSGSYLFRLVSFNPFDSSIVGYSEFYEATVTID